MTLILCCQPELGIHQILSHSAIKLPACQPASLWVSCSILDWDPHWGTGDAPNPSNQFYSFSVSKLRLKALANVHVKYCNCTWDSHCLVGVGILARCHPPLTGKSVQKLFLYFAFFVSKKLTCCTQCALRKNQLACVSPLHLTLCSPLCFSFRTCFK